MKRYTNARMSEDLTMKRCCTCDEWKDLIDFHRNSSNNDGYQNSCVLCLRAKRSVKRELDPEQQRRRERAAYRKKPKAQVKQENWRRYGIELTVEQYESMLETQNGVCAICDQPESFPNRGLAVDHCHTTGKIRGLLCGKCNQAIGILNDDIDILKRAIEYLNQYGGSSEAV